MNLKDQKLLITGATGNLGRQLVYECLRAGVRPIVLVRRESDTRYIDANNLEKRVADLRNQAEVEKAVQGVDVVIHCAAWVNFRQDKLTQFTGINTFGALGLYRACAKTGVKRFVHLSSVAAVGARPRAGDNEKRLINEDWVFNLEHLQIPYIMTKRAAEDELRRQAGSGGPELVIVNPSIIVAPSRTGDDHGRATRMFSHWILPDLFNIVNLVDIRDVASAILAAVEKGRSGERYILAGDNIPVRELALSVSALLTDSPHLIEFPRWFYMGAACVTVAVRTLFGRSKISFYPDLVRLMDYDWAFSHAKARVDLGFSPRSIHVTLNDLLSNNFVGTPMKPGA